MNLVYDKGVKLLVELTGGEVYEGEYISGDNNRITLLNVSQYPDEAKMSNPYHFYRMEIASIRPLSTDAENKSSPCDGTTIQTTFSINDSHLEKYKQLISEYIYMALVDERYHNAVVRLKESDIVSVVGMGSRFGRYSNISFMAIANKNQVYIFDVKQSQSRVFDLGLRDILESEDILKVVHNSKSLSDCLFHCHNVKLTNVYDTQIADLLLLKKENNKLPEKTRKFSELVNAYLNIPKTVIEKTETSSKTLLERPICNDIKSNVSMLAVYLLAIKRVTESRLFEDFNKCVQFYLGVMKDAESVVARQINTDFVPKIIKDLNINT